MTLVLCLVHYECNQLIIGRLLLLVIDVGNSLGNAFPTSAPHQHSICQTCCTILATCILHVCLMCGVVCVGHSLGASLHCQQHRVHADIYRATCTATALLCRVVCVGHSLGAALATLAAFWCKTISPQVGAQGRLPLHCGVLSCGVFVEGQTVDASEHQCPAAGGGSCTRYTAAPSDVASGNNIITLDV